MSRKERKIAKSLDDFLSKTRRQMLLQISHREKEVLRKINEFKMNVSSEVIENFKECEKECMESTYQSMKNLFGQSRKRKRVLSDSEDDYALEQDENDVVQARPSNYSNFDDFTKFDSDEDASTKQSEEVYLTKPREENDDSTKSAGEEDDSTKSAGEEDDSIKSAGEEDDSTKSADEEDAASKSDDEDSEEVGNKDGFVDEEADESDGMGAHNDEEYQSLHRRILSASKDVDDCDEYEINYCSLS